jgi:hypothetical protein
MTIVTLLLSMLLALFKVVKSESLVYFSGITSCVSTSELSVTDKMVCPLKPAQAYPGPCLTFSSKNKKRYKVYLDFESCKPQIYINGTWSPNPQDKNGGICYYPPKSIPMSVHLAVDLETGIPQVAKYNKNQFSLTEVEGDDSSSDSLKVEPTVKPEIDVNIFDWF